MHPALIDISPHELTAGMMASDKLSTLHHLFATEGYVVVTNLISAEVCAQLEDAFLQDVAAIRERAALTPHERQTAVGHLQLGARRYAPFVSRELVANNVIEHVISELLGRSAWLGFYSGNVNCPGSGHQPVHFDRPFTWRSPSEAQDAGQPWPPPTTTVSCSLALTDINQTSGATEIYPGTHRETAVTQWPRGERPEKHPKLVERWGPPQSMRIPAGGVCFRDPRMWHRGVPNTSSVPRPMIALTYHSVLMKHWRGLLVSDLNMADQARCAGDDSLRVLDDGSLGDGRLLFDITSRPAFERPSLHGIDRNTRFVKAPLQVNHFLDNHTIGGARVIPGETISPYPDGGST
jgi:ectoine hydroxylase-related dioxygenase (phytanoyl-CoA dioxygenase family)